MISFIKRLLIAFILVLIVFFTGYFLGEKKVLRNKFIEIKENIGQSGDKIESEKNQKEPTKKKIKSNNLKETKSIKTKKSEDKIKDTILGIAH